MEKTLFCRLIYKGISEVYALKRLLNHKMSSDVTDGYVIIDTLLKLMGVKEMAKMIQLNMPEKLNEDKTA